MSEPKITLKTIMDIVHARPTSLEFDLALMDFLELSDSEQKALLFKEMVNIGSQVNWIVNRLRNE